MEPAAQVTGAVLAALARLLPQLSATPPLDVGLLQQVVDSEAAVLLLARLDGAARDSSLFRHEVQPSSQPTG